MNKTLTTIALLGTHLPLYAAALPCLMQPDEVVDLGASAVGVVTSVQVDRGDHVSKGQLIATLDSEVEKRGVQLASERFKDDAELKSAAAAMEHANREKQRARKMYEQKLVSRQFLDKATTEASIAEYRYRQAESRLKQTSLELKVANARLQQKRINSPIEGIVTERFVASGQRIQEGPLVRIVKATPLRIEVIVSAEHFGKFEKGERFMVKPELPGLPSREAEIKIIDRVIDSASNSFRLTLAMDNTDGTMPAGARCTVDLNTDETR